MVTDPGFTEVVYQFVRTTDYEEIHKLGKAGWALVTVVSVGDGLLHYLERAVERPATS